MKIKSIISASASATLGLGLVVGAVSPGYAAPTDVNKSNASSTTTAEKSDFWFKSKEGTRTFNVVDNKLVPKLLKGDQLRIENNVINTYDSNGTLVASIKSDLPQGLALDYSGGAISVKDAKPAVSTGTVSARGYKCIDNKWVSFGLNTVADGLVCAPLGVATGGVGGFACGAAVGAGITALSC